jgi:hypothetical protein
MCICYYRLTLQAASLLFLYLPRCLFGASNLILYDKRQQVIELKQTSAINTISTINNPTIKITTRNTT